MWRHPGHLISVTGGGGDVEAFLLWCAKCDGGDVAFRMIKDPVRVPDDKPPF